MKAEELMIGDWVISKDLKVPVKVRSIMNHYGTSIYFYHNGSEFIVQNFQIEPIPLTEEILKKNGYESNRWNQYDMHIESDVCVVIDNKCCIHGFDSQVIIHCQYVHQFQHALQLCGIQKEIQL